MIKTPSWVIKAQRNNIKLILELLPSIKFVLLCVKFKLANPSHCHFVEHASHMSNGPLSIFSCQKLMMRGETYHSLLQINGI